MRKKKARKEKEETFESSFKSLVGSKFYGNLSVENRKIIHEMSECRSKSGSIGSCPIVEIR